MTPLSHGFVFCGKGLQSSLPLALVFKDWLADSTKLLIPRSLKLDPAALTAL